MSRHELTPVTEGSIELPIGDRRRSAPCSAGLNIRRELTDSRSRAISLARAITRGAGFRIRSGSTERFLNRVTARDLPSSITETLSPLRSLIDVLTKNSRARTTRLRHWSRRTRSSPV